jgi:deoxyribodipyrimidine photo-lyase
MEPLHFTTSYDEIIRLIDAIDPVRYGSTRNYLDGAVSRLSPYLSRGVISPADIVERLSARFSFGELMRLYQQLAWREFFQRVWQEKGDAIFHDLRTSTFPYARRLGMSSSMLNAATGIFRIDEMIRGLYDFGYMHNHGRLYVASLCANIARLQWLEPSKWMYYHLLDGDLASNMLSWQWVAGTFSVKPYLFNQDNVNLFSRTSQRGTFLDVPYEDLPSLAVPPVLGEVETALLQTVLPSTPFPTIDVSKPTLVYNSYNLDSQWRSEGFHNRVLLLEPSHFERFPVSERVLSFVIALSANIPGLQVFVGEFAALEAMSSSIVYREHHSVTHYRGTRDERKWLFPRAKGPFTSFSKFWKQGMKELGIRVG